MRPNRSPRFRPSFEAAAFVVLGLRDDALVEHRLQHLGAPDLGGLRVHERVVAARTLRQAGQQRRLGDRQILGALREVDLRGRLGAVRAVPVRNGVQVLLEDPLLGALLLELARDQRLVQLALQRDLVGDLRVDVPHQLLGQRRAALGHTPGLEVLDGGAADGLPVDAVVLVEAPVLDRDGRGRQPRRDAVERDVAAVLVARDHGQAAAVARVDGGVLALRHLLQLVQVREPVVVVRRADGRDHDDADEQHQHRHEDRADDRAGACAPAALRAPDAGARRPCGPPSQAPASIPSARSAAAARSRRSDETSNAVPPSATQAVTEKVANVRGDVGDADGRRRRRDAAGDGVRDLLQHGAGARQIGAGRDRDGDGLRTGGVFDGRVHDGRGDQLLVRKVGPPAIVRPQHGIRQFDLFNHSAAGVRVDPVAEPERLGEGDLEAGGHVAERRAQREARHDRGDGARREQRPRELLRRRDRCQSCQHPDQDDDGDDDAADQPEARLGAREVAAVVLGQAPLLRPEPALREPGQRRRRAPRRSRS